GPEAERDRAAGPGGQDEALLPAVEAYRRQRLPVQRRGPALVVVLVHLQVGGFSRADAELALVRLPAADGHGPGGRGRGRAGAGQADIGNRERGRGRGGQGVPTRAEGQPP